MKNINFAQTFKPEKQYIGSLLKIAEREEVMTTKQISLETGIPMGTSSGKVVPHIEYCKFMGLIDYEKKDVNTYILKITPLGKIVLEEDPGIRENLTILLLNSMLLRDIEGAPIWDSMFGKILPKYHGRISIDDAIKELNIIYENKITKKNFAPFLNSYEDMFSPLNYFNRTSSDDIELTYLPKVDSDFVYLYCFILFIYWDESFKDRLEITANEFSELNFGHKLNSDIQTEYKILELINEKGLIRLNRQMNPYTIMRLASKDELMHNLYSELF